MAAPDTTGLNSVHSAMHHATITPSANVIDPLPTAIRADTSGTITIEDPDGTSIDYNVVAGEVLPFRPTKVTASSATLIAWYSF